MINPFQDDSPGSIQKCSPMVEHFLWFLHNMLKKAHYAISQMLQSWHYAGKLF